MRHDHRWKHGLGFPVFIAVFAAAAAIVMLLWNALIPHIFGWHTLGYWHACGLLLLTRILFGGLGRMGWCHPKGGHRFPQQDRSRMADVRQQIRGMTAEERREFIHSRMRDFHDAYHQPETPDKE